jgi:23S rRNA (cytosine1962-C5)-methyltransferase
LEGLSVAQGVLSGTHAGAIEVKLNGLVFSTDPLSGHKTGLYLDQQVNYQLVADLAQRSQARQALDCFCFQGGFALHLARAGLHQVHGVDQSPETIRQAEENARINGLADRCSFEAANVFDWFKNQTAHGPREKTIPRFDVIVLDPPSFTRHRSTVLDALRGYKEIHLRALKLLKPGGVLATFCCSHHVDESTFRDVILSAAFDAKRVLRRVASMTQAPDHPVVPSIPETEYLKGFCFELM